MNPTIVLNPNERHYTLVLEFPTDETSVLNVTGTGISEKAVFAVARLDNGSLAIKSVHYLNLPSLVIACEYTRRHEQDILRHLSLRKQRPGIDLRPTTNWSVLARFKPYMVIDLYRVLEKSDPKAAIVVCGTDGNYKPAMGYFGVADEYLNNKPLFDGESRLCEVMGGQKRVFILFIGTRADVYPTYDNAKMVRFRPMTVEQLRKMVDAADATMAHNAKVVIAGRESHTYQQVTVVRGTAQKCDKGLIYDTDAPKLERVPVVVFGGPRDMFPLTPDGIVYSE